MSKSRSNDNVNDEMPSTSSTYKRPRLELSVEGTNPPSSSQLPLGRVESRDGTTRVVAVHHEIMCHLQPHQVNGIRFMFRNCYGQEPTGCLLGHDMGLGKSLQVIALLQAVMGAAKKHKALIICSKAVAEHWYGEFQKWYRNCHPVPTIWPIWQGKAATDGVECVRLWTKEGGVGLIHYDRFRKYSEMAEGTSSDSRYLQSSLFSPGPDIVILDEGHLLKSPHSQISIAVNRIRSPRRIILSGTPLENDLEEFHSILSIICPSKAGSWALFKKNFQLPIASGEYRDSESKDVKGMKAQAKVLRTRFDAQIQRVTKDVLEEALPPLIEYVIFTRLSLGQEEAYLEAIEPWKAELGSMPRHSSPNFMTDYHKWNEIWSLPRPQIPGNAPEGIGGKLAVLYSIIEQCSRTDDKVLVFSQYHQTLNRIEEALLLVPSLVFGENLFRLDGKVTAVDREKRITLFNSGTRVFKVFLISSGAGSLGINLSGATRVVIFDVSWNPAEDSQSISRAHRVPQKDPVTAYRLVAYGTMEVMMRRQQVAKQALAARIVDGLDPARPFTKSQMKGYFDTTNDEDEPDFDPPTDELLQVVINAESEWVHSVQTHNPLAPDEDEHLKREANEGSWKISTGSSTNREKRMRDEWEEGDSEGTPECDCSDSNSREEMDVVPAPNSGGRY